MVEHYLHQIMKFILLQIKKKNIFNNFPIKLYLKNFILFILLKFLLSKIVYNYFFFYILKFAHEKNIKSLLNLIYPAFKFKPKQKIPTEYYSKISNYSIKLIDKIISDPEFELNRIKRKENNQLYLKLLF